MELSSYEKNYLDQLIRLAEKDKSKHSQDTMIIYNNCGLQGGYPINDNAPCDIVYRTDTKKINPKFVSKPIKSPKPVNSRLFIMNRFVRCL